MISRPDGRRKLPVTIAGLVMATAALLLALASLVGHDRRGRLAGSGFGVYLSVDAALVTQVLPSAEGGPRTWA